MEPFHLTLWPLFVEAFSSHSHTVSAEDCYIDDVSIDSRTIKGKSSLFVALQGNQEDGHIYVEEALQQGASFALVATTWNAPPHIDTKKLLRVKNTLQALQDLAKTIRCIKAKTCVIIAIAGCTGKTMLKDLITHVFCDYKSIYASPESYNSQIGVALSIINIPSTASFAFIEMAANKPNEMEKLLYMVQPDHAIITNFFRPRYGIDTIKSEIIDQLFVLITYIQKQKSNGWIIVEKPSIALSAQKKSSLFSHENTLFWNELKPEFLHIQYINTGACPLQIGIFSCTNTMLGSCAVPSHFPFVVELIQIALLVSYILKIDMYKVVLRLQTYKPQFMRTELWKNAMGITFINGTYSHEAFSFAASLEEMALFLEQSHFTRNFRRALIFGGLKHNLFDQRHKKRILESIKNLHISHIFYWPETTAHFLDIATSHDFAITLHPCTDLQDAIYRAVKNPPDSYAFQTVIFKGQDKSSLDYLFQEIEDSPPQTYVSINLASIRHNIDLLRKKMDTPQRLMVMVKALAYGTDDIRIAHFLKKCGIDIVGVSYVDEGVSMRKKGVRQHIFVVNAMPEEMTKAIKWDLEVGVGSIEQIEAAAAAAISCNKKVKVHLHVDTGMKRFGCHVYEAENLSLIISRYSEHITFEGLFSHFCSADDCSQDAYTQWQIDTMTTLYQLLKEKGITPNHLHIANSAALLRFSFSNIFTMARIGLAIYGIYTCSTLRYTLEKSIALRPALSLVSKIAGINHAKKGDTISYGRTHLIDAHSARIAVLPIGYYDGLHRIYSGKVHVLIRGIKAAIVGRICMDYMMVDISHIHEASIGDTALIFGEDEMGNVLSVEEFAEQGGSIPHELMTCLGPRIQRLFMYDESLITR